MDTKREVLEVTDEVKKDQEVHKELNIKGEVCPYTFVKTKLTLEKMDPGQILRVVVDHLPATLNPLDVALIVVCSIGVLPGPTRFA